MELKNFEKRLFPWVRGFQLFLIEKGDIGISVPHFAIDMSLRVFGWLGSTDASQNEHVWRSS